MEHMLAHGGCSGVGLVVFVGTGGCHMMTTSCADIGGLEGIATTQSFQSIQCTVSSISHINCLFEITNLMIRASLPGVSSITNVYDFLFDAKELLLSPRSPRVLPRCLTGISKGSPSLQISHISYTVLYTLLCFSFVYITCLILWNVLADMGR